MVEEMALTPLAQGITDVFFDMDFAILSAYHSLAESPAGTVLSPILNAVTLTGWKGAFLILLSLALIVFRKTRRTGICCLLGLMIGAVFTNLIVKNAVARPRPYNFDNTLRTWWIYAGSHMESDLSFPSGHMTAACGFTSAFVLSRGKKWLPAGVVYVTLMGISRNFLIVHYPSDVVGGFFFGTCAGVISFFIVRAVYRKWGGTPLLRESA